MNLDAVTVRIRIVIGGENVPLWRVGLLGVVARILCVRFRVEAEDA